jgi:transposase
MSKGVSKMKNRYDQAFRQEAIRLALTGNKSIAQTARDLGIKDSVLYNWISQAKASGESVEVGNTKLRTSELIEELQRVKKENARLREERDILKKATVFFAQWEDKK